MRHKSRSLRHNSIELDHNRIGASSDVPPKAALSHKDPTLRHNNTP